MKPWALVPAKGFGAGKSRLDAVLGADARAALARHLLEGVLDAIAESTAVDAIVVITSDPEVEAVARTRGATICADPAGARGLASVVDAGLAAAASRGAEAALVLMGDLPRLTPEDVRALARPLAEVEMVIGPDHLEMGTNALGLRPPTRVLTCFGNEDSLHRHLALAAAEGLRSRLVRRPGIARDLDTPADLEETRTRG